MIRKISVQVKTGDSENSGTNGYVYLGLGGREYLLNIPGEDDFEPGDDITYVLGESSNVAHPEENDPRTCCVTCLEDLGLFPAYIRLHPRGMGDSWEMGRVHVRVLTADGECEYAGVGEDRTLWLGWAFGLTCYLKKL